MGHLLEVRGKEGVVAVGVMKLTVPLKSLTRSTQQRAKPEINVPIMGDAPEVHANTEIDLRGMRVGERIEDRARATYVPTRGHHDAGLLDSFLDRVKAALAA